MKVGHNPAKRRFELHLEGKTAHTDYMLATGKIVFTHTEVPPELESRGLANRLSEAALNFARSEELVVVPLCPFVAAYIRKHPEYADLVMPGYHY